MVPVQVGTIQIRIKRAIKSLMICIILYDSYPFERALGVSNKEKIDRATA